MKAQILLASALLVSTNVMAAPKLVICERPTWVGAVTDCGPNHTFSTHTFLIDTDDFDKEAPEYEYQAAQGCDVSQAPKYRYPYSVTPSTISFVYDFFPDSPGDMAKFDLNRETLVAVMSNAAQNKELNCRIEDVVTINKI